MGPIYFLGHVTAFIVNDSSFHERVKSGYDDYIILLWSSSKLRC